MTIKLHPKAEEDLSDALNYFVEVDEKLKEKFISYLDDTFNKIIKFPNIYQYETKTVQKVLMEKFPYIILYEQY